MELISSVQNPKIKFLTKLGKASERKSAGLFTVEGIREISHALTAGYELESLFYADQIADAKAIAPVLERLPKAKLHQVSNHVFEKIAYREGSDGLFAVFVQIPHHLDMISLPRNPLILVMDGVEKPGNIGAMLRTSDAVGVDAVIISNPVTDLYNPNLIRSSLGTVFTQQIALAKSEQALHWLNQNGISDFAASLQTDLSCYEQNFTGPTAIVVGSEADGVSEIWRSPEIGQIKIPMFGRADSMNVSVAAAILLFEARRQRLNPIR